ncbi:MAG: CAP domain-containing protein [Acidimicrobiia bacterium]
MRAHRAIAAALAVVGLIGMGQISAVAQEQSGCPKPSASELRLARELNGLREARDLRNLELDRQLTAVADLHSREMAKEGRARHTPMKTLADRVTRWDSLGESTLRATSVPNAINRLVRNDAERSMLYNGDWRYLGIGITRKDGFLWVTVLNESRRDPGTTITLSC